MRRLLAVLALLVAVPAVHAQPAPAVDYARFLDVRFFPQQGQFQFGTPIADFLLFPPAGLDRYDVDGAYVVRDAGGAVVGTQRLGTLDETGSAAFLRVGTRSGPEWPGTLQHGARYTLDFVLAGEVVGALPFTVAVEEGGDPFDPRTTIVLDGPWRTHAYFEHETDRPDYILHFNAWVAPDDLPRGSKTEVSIRRDGAEVAWGSAHVDLQYGWDRAEYRLLTPEGRPDEHGRRGPLTNFTIQDVRPGTYEVVLSDGEGRVLRRFSVEGGQGTFRAHARSDVGYTPRGLFLTPRSIAHNSLDKAVSRYWVVNE